MSDKSLNMSCEHQDCAAAFLSNRSRLLDVDGNYTLSLSPDSEDCNFNLSLREDFYSPGVNTLSTSGTVLPGHAVTQRKLSTILENSLITTSDNGNVLLFNDTFSILRDQDSDEGTRSAAVSPDSVEMSSCGTSCRGSMDLSFSSGEMLVRSNSLILEEQTGPLELSLPEEPPATPGMSKDEMNISWNSEEMTFRSNSLILEEAAALVVSSFEESPGLPVMSHAESNFFITPLCDQEGAGERVESHPSLGTTFTVGSNIELPSEEDSSFCKSFLALQGEKVSLRTTFLCENSVTDVANEAQFIQSQSEIVNETYVLVTPAQALRFDSPVCLVKDDKCTSTPLLKNGSSVPSLPSFALSPCVESTGSPALQPVLKKRSALTPNQSLRGSSISGSKVTKMEINKFPKLALSGVKCKHNPASSNVRLNKPSLMNSRHEGPSPPRSINSTTSPTTKAAQNSQRTNNLGANKERMSLQKSNIIEEGQIKNKTSDYSPAVHCSPANHNPECGTSSQNNTDPKAHTANTTFCYPEKSPPKSVKTVPQASPKKDVTDKTKKMKSAHSFEHDKPTPKAPTSCLSASSESYTSASRQDKISKPQKLSSSLVLSKSKTGNIKSTSHGSSGRAGLAPEAAQANCRQVKKIGLVTDPKTPSSTSCTTGTNTRVRAHPSPKQTGQASTSRASAASVMPTSPLNKQRLGRDSGRDFGRESCGATAAVGTQSKLKPTGSGNARGEPFHTPASAARTKTSSQNLQTTPRSSVMGPPRTPGPRLQQPKNSGLTRSQNESVTQSRTSDSSRTTNVSEVAGRHPTPFKVPVLKTRTITTKTSTPALTAPCKSSSASKALPSANSPKRTAAKLIRLTAPVDKGKPKAGVRPQQQQQQSERGTARPPQGKRGEHDVGPAAVTGARVQLLQAQLIQSNRGCEALAVVLQQTLAQRDEAVRQSRGLSQELLELRGELMNTVNRSEGLAQEKEALKASLQEALEQVQAQHQKDLEDLEQRLKEQHQTEMRAVQEQLSEEAAKSRERYTQQMERFEETHKAIMKDLETTHSVRLQSVRLDQQDALRELSQVHAQELECLNKTLQDTELVLNDKIRELTQENAALMDRLTEEENRIKDMSQKDSQTVYLEQELESLKAVLDIKNEQLKQHQKKMMEFNKLTENNVKLEERLSYVQQENEDLKARMERHAALSRQLSTEQTILQESLQKETNVNKRLSMENEELQWKLYNGDLSSPRRSSPNPPSPFSLQSPRGPSLFSSPPVSPR